MSIDCCSFTLIQHYLDNTEFDPNVLEAIRYYSFHNLEAIRYIVYCILQNLAESGVICDVYTDVGCEGV